MLTRRSGGLLLGVLLAGSPVCAQTPAPPSFDVATIKTSPPYTSVTMNALTSGQIRIGLNVTGSRVTIVDVVEVDHVEKTPKDD